MYNTFVHRLCIRSVTIFFLQFGALTPLEPRLGKKLIEPLTNLIHRYFAKLYTHFIDLIGIYLLKRLTYANGGGAIA